MRTCVGVDGCRAGWIAALDTGAGIETRLVRDLTDLLDTLPPNAVVGIDIPIGLPEGGPRECDLAARQYLGWPRAASVFAAPLRTVLRATSYEEACAISRECQGKALSKQAYNILPKIREVDPLVRKGDARLMEVHPEVSFAAMNDGQAIIASKRQAAGRAVRTELLKQQFGADVVERVPEYPRKWVAPDDLSDAFACLWSARRVAAEIAFHLPARSVRDGANVPMRIVC